MTMKGPFQLQIFIGGVVVVFPFSSLEGTDDGILSFILEWVRLSTKIKRGEVS